MKKLDTYYLSEKQLEQIRQMKKGKRVSLRIIFVVLLFIMSCACGILLNYTKNYNLEMILTGICGFSGLGCVIVLISDSGKVGGSFNPEFEKK